MFFSEHERTTEGTSAIMSFPDIFLDYMLYDEPKNYSLVALKTTACGESLIDSHSKTL